MPRAGPLRQMLNALSVKELRAVRREFCPKVKSYSEQDGKNSFVGSIRDSLKLSMEKGEISHYELMQFLREELSDTIPKQITTKIRNVLKEIQISKNAGNKKSVNVREKWICSEIYQTLICELEDTEYEVKIEEDLDNRYRADLLVSHKSGKRNYLIEVKLVGSSGGGDRLPYQITKYQNCISYLKRTFVVMIIQDENNLPESNDAVAKVKEEVESKDKTEVVVKGPGELGYR